MGKIQPIRPGAAAPPPRTPERQALAEAIERHANAATEHRRLDEALGRFRTEVWWPATEKSETTAAALKELKSREGDVWAAEFLGDSADVEKLRVAQAAADEANAAKGRADETYGALENRAGKAKAEFESAEESLNRVHRAAVKVDPAMAEIISQYETAKRELAKFSVLMSELFMYAPTGYHYYTERIYSDLDRSDCEKWRAAIEALKHDADAPLPATAAAERN